MSGAQLTPADVEVGDIVEAAREGAGRRIDFVVREAQARLGAWLHRCECPGLGDGEAAAYTWGCSWGCM